MIGPLKQPLQVGRYSLQEEFDDTCMAIAKKYVISWDGKFIKNSLTFDSYIYNHMIC